MPNTRISSAVQYDLDASGNVTGLVGPDGGYEKFGYSIRNWLTPSFVGSSTSKGVFTTAVAANAAKVAYVGHSIANGNNQNFYGATVYNMLRTVLKEAFPNVVYTFENYGLGGTKAGDFLGNPNTTIAAVSTSVYREYWQNDSGAITSTAAWANKVATFAPDLIFLHWDLNETNANTFATDIQAIIDDINANARWAAKRPSIVLVSSHTGITNGSSTTAIIRHCHKALRALARKNKVALVDAGRIYDIMVTGIDPVNLIPVVSGEIALVNRAVAATNLDATYYESKVGTAYSPTGTTIRNNPSQALTFYRNYLHADGAVQGTPTSGAITGTLSLFYRVDPDDANYATGTGAQYEIRLDDDGANTTAQAYYWSGGSASAISGATVTLTNRLGTNTQFQMRAEYKGCSHKVTIYAPSNEVKTFEFYDFNSVAEGYAGWGVGGTGGGFWGVGSAGNVSTGFVQEFWDAPSHGYTAYTDTELLGSLSSAAGWNVSYGTNSGNSINHLTNEGYKVVYEQAFYDVMRQLQP